MGMMIQAELLTETTDIHFQRMAMDTRFGFQEKHNGHRLLICKENGVLSMFNRKGEKSCKPLPHLVKKALLSHPLNFIIDAELVGHSATLFIFDALILGDEVLTNYPYEYREARYHAVFSGFASALHPVKTARTWAEKMALWETVEQTRGEGLVSKNMNAGYRQGEANQHFKLKFRKSADAVVIGPNPEGKDSVEIGMYDEHGNMHRISGLSLRNKFRLVPGQVIEVSFLYATKERHIVQPVLEHVRMDKSAAQCKLSQLVPYINKNWTVTHVS